MSRSATAFPRPFGRGPIDAFTSRGGSDRACNFPRPFGRGPIDATFWAYSLSLGSSSFRGRLAAAPLTRGIALVVEVGQGLSAAVWPRPH